MYRSNAYVRRYENLGGREQRSRVGVRSKQIVAAEQLYDTVGGRQIVAIGGAGWRGQRAGGGHGELSIGVLLGALAVVQRRQAGRLGHRR